MNLQTGTRRLRAALLTLALAALLAGFALLPGLLFYFDDFRLDGSQVTGTAPLNSLSAEGIQVPLARHLYENRLLYANSVSQQQIELSSAAAAQPPDVTLELLYNAGVLSGSEWEAAKAVLASAALQVTAREDGVLTSSYAFTTIQWLPRAGLPIDVRLNDVPGSISAADRLAAWKRFLMVDSLTDWEICMENETTVCQYSPAGQLFISASGSDTQIGLHIYSLSPEEYASLDFLQTDGQDGASPGR